jgi:RND family efflux transporter MFP subunit
MHSKNRQLLIPAIAAALVLSGCGGGGAQPPQQGAPPVTVAAPLVRDVVDWDEFVGRFEAIQSVDVRPRASGYLEGIWFKDGQYVQKGQLLFTVDARPAQAAVAQAVAQVAQAQATLANAKTEYARSEALVAQRAASQEELEQRRAAMRSATAQVAAAEANLRAQRLSLGFTRVVAPLSGRISERKVDVGNSVTADQTVLTTIVSVDPIHFVFQGSEALLLKYQRDGSGTRDGTAIKVKLSDENDYTHDGKIDFVDNALDAGAGTIRARAIINNPGGFLKAGMFGSARLEASKPYPAMLVPDTAIMADAARQIVFVVDKSNTVTARPVQTGPLRGNLRVIRSGITREDRVIIDGTQRARPGVKVTPQPGKITETPAASAPPADAPASTAQPAGNR